EVAREGRELGQGGVAGGAHGLEERRLRLAGGDQVGDGLQDRRQVADDGARHRGVPRRGGAEALGVGEGVRGRARVKAEAHACAQTRHALVEASGERLRPARGAGARSCHAQAAPLPWQCLYFLPLPQGQGSLRPTFSSTRIGDVGPLARAWAGPGPRPAAAAAASTGLASGAEYVTDAGLAARRWRPRSRASSVWTCTRKSSLATFRRMFAFISSKRLKPSKAYSCSGLRWPWPRRPMPCLSTSMLWRCSFQCWSTTCRTMKRSSSRSSGAPSSAS